MNRRKLLTTALAAAGLPTVWKPEAGASLDPAFLHGGSRWVIGVRTTSKLFYMSGPVESFDMNYWSSLREKYGDDASISLSVDGKHYKPEVAP